MPMNAQLFGVTVNRIRPGNEPGKILARSSNRFDPREEVFRSKQANGKAVGRRIRKCGGPSESVF